jgi:hypothetical protein
MPRDITHWLIADDTAALLPPDGCYGAAARRGPALLRLGAVFHDALFYAPPALGRFARVADRLHSEAGEDSFAPVRALHGVVGELRAVASPLADDVGAFLVGFVSHLHADATFHPLVYYHTGLPGPSGCMASTVSQAHRRLEALIDLHFVGSLRALDDWSLAGYVGAAGRRARDLSWLAARVLVGPAERAELAATLDASWARYARAQGVFRSRALGHVAWSLRRYLSDANREIVALAYAPALRTLLPRVAGEIDYRHPVTGEPGRVSLATLRRTAAAAAAATLARLEATPPAAEPLAGEVGPSLVAGVPGLGYAALVCCAPTPLVPL